MAYTDPFRLRVLKALTAALEEITPANGYTFDLAGKVFRGREIFGEDDPIPMVSILEVPDEMSQNRQPTGSTTLEVKWELLIQGFVDDDFENPTDPAQHLQAQVKKRLSLERKKAQRAQPGTPSTGILGMNGAVMSLDLSPGVVRPPDGISGKAYFWLRCDITMVENLSDPYE